MSLGISTPTTNTGSVRFVNALTASKLPKFSWLFTLIGSLAVSLVTVWIVSLAGNTPLNIGAVFVLAAVLYCVLIWVMSRIVEGSRKARDRLVTALVTIAFLIALVPIVSVTLTTVINGAHRFDGTFFSSSMRNIDGAGGGALHAIVGTLLITGMATLISVPIGLLTAIYLVEYGRGRLKQAITFLVDVMTGIPSIVAGLFAFSLFVLITGDAGYRSGFGGAVALSVLMIPVVVRSSEEMLKIVPNELREAAYALGVPKWLTVIKVVLRTSVAGLITSVMLAISRVIGETAPLLIIAGTTMSINYDIFSGRIATLPVFVYGQYASQGVDEQTFVDRAWTGALTLILIVAALNVIARLVARYAAPKGLR